MGDCKHEEVALIIDLGLWCCTNPECGLILPAEEVDPDE